MSKRPKQEEGEEEEEEPEVIHADVLQKQKGWYQWLLLVLLVLLVLLMLLLSRARGSDCGARHSPGSSACPTKWHRSGTRSAAYARSTVSPKRLPPHWLPFCRSTRRQCSRVGLPRTPVCPCPSFPVRSRPTRPPTSPLHARRRLPKTQSLRTGRASSSPRPSGHPRWAAWS